MTIADRLREIADDFIVKAPNGGILSERQQYWELRKIADELDAKANEINANVARLRNGTLKLTDDYLEIIASSIGGKAS